MSIISELKNRRAIRDYREQDVEDEKIKTLLEAATWAPNDRMREPWNFYVIKGEAKKRYEALAKEYLEERFPTKPHLPSMKTVMTMIITVRKLWNQTMLSITGEPDCWSVHSHGAGCPSSANATPPVASVRPATANPSKCRPTRPIDILMPFALPLRSHPKCTPLISGKCLFDPPV